MLVAISSSVRTAMLFSAGLLPIVVWSCFFIREASPFECGNSRAYGGAHLHEYISDKDLAFPWTVAITRSYKKYVCLGSVVHELSAKGLERNGSRIILTAGSCFRSSKRKAWKKPRNFRVIAGIQRYSKFSRRGYKGYPSHIRVSLFKTGGNGQLWDGVAAVFLKKPLMFNKFVVPVCAASPRLVLGSYDKCYVTHYHKGRLVEETISLVSPSVYDFGRFPELSRIGGLCASYQRTKGKKYLGAPLVCIYQGRAYQYGIYLSDLLVKNNLDVVTNTFHYFAPLSPYMRGSGPHLPT
ncbi:hypothetical protein M513_13903, partial [Trichuris suis]